MSKTCIFCNSTGRKSKEHLWPVWMHEHLPLIGNGYNVSELNTFKWKNQIGAKKTKRQGHLTTKKIRVVCQKCNNGWMSMLENEAKPILTKILNDESFKLCAKNQQTIAQWITLKSIIGEHDDRDLRVTPFAERNLFRKQLKIPNSYAIYIGRHGEKSDTAWLRTSQTIAKSRTGPNPPLGNLQRNMQSIAFICGSLFVYVLTIREHGIKAYEFLSLPKLIQIFPTKPTEINWPPNTILGSIDMELAAWALDEMKNLSNVNYAGDLPEA